MVNLMPKMLEILEELNLKHGRIIHITLASELFAEKLGILNRRTFNEKLDYLNLMGYIKYERYDTELILTDKVIEKMKTLKESERN